MLQRLHASRTDEAAAPALQKWAAALGIELRSCAASSGAAAGDDEEEGEESDEEEEAEEAEEEEEEEAPSLPLVPRPKGRQKLAIPTGDELSSFADARGRAL